MSQRERMRYSTMTAIQVNAPENNEDKTVNQVSLKNTNAMAPN